MPTDTQLGSGSIRLSQTWRLASLTSRLFQPALSVSHPRRVLSRSLKGRSEDRLKTCSSQQPSRQKPAQHWGTGKQWGLSEVQERWWVRGSGISLSGRMLAHHVRVCPSHPSTAQKRTRVLGTLNWLNLYL